MKEEKRMGLLNDIKVLEVAEGIAGPYCGKLLADLGAEVIKLELPGIGDRARAMAPFKGSAQAPEGSVLFCYLNTNKLSVTLNWLSHAAEDILLRLIKEADILVTDENVLRREGSIVNLEELQKLYPTVVQVAITSFGIESPYSNYKAYDIVAVNMGGFAGALPGHIEDSAKEPPLRAAGQQSEYLAGLYGAIGALEGLFARKMTDRPLLIDVSKQEAIASMMSHLVTGLGSDPSMSRSNPTRGRFQRVATHLPCRDGYIVVTMQQDQQWQRLLKTAETMGCGEWIKDERFQAMNSAVEHWDILYPLLTEDWTKLHSMDELVGACQANGVPLGPVNTPPEIANSSQLQDRSFFLDVKHPYIGMVSLPGGPFRHSLLGSMPSAPSPLLGQHTEMILTERLGYAAADVSRMRMSGVI